MRRRIGPSSNPLVRFQRAFERGFERVRGAYQMLLTSLVLRRKTFIPIFLLGCVSHLSADPVPRPGLFPEQRCRRIHPALSRWYRRSYRGDRRLADLVEASVRRTIPHQELNNILDNLGLPVSQMNTMHLTNGAVGAADGDIMVTLNEKHHPTADYIRELRANLPREFPGTTFYFLPADETTQILNFGLPAPIDVQLQSDDVRGELPGGDQAAGSVETSAWVDGSPH